MVDSIQFLLNQELISINDVNPSMTVLQYLRERQSIMGTKEGCAEGDCGACSVVVVEIVNNKLSYKAINSCILFVGSLHGKQLITVEGLKFDNKLHPVQQAMVDFHGSQCGFCTPGFIMTLFAMYHMQKSFSVSEIHNHLAGNLCRCTGYRPIIDAAASIKFTGDHFENKKEETITLLKSITKGGLLTFRSESTTFFIPDSLNSLLELRHKYPVARLLAGGTDLGLMISKHFQVLSEIILLGKVSELKQIEETQSHLCFGAAVSYSDLLPYFQKNFPSLYNMVLRLGSVQIRNSGSMGGNLMNASPIGDSAPPLMVLDATVTLVSQKGQREVSLSELFVDYRKTSLHEDEVLLNIKIPKIVDQEKFEVFKISKRFDQDISTCCGAFFIKIENDLVKSIRIAFGGMAATPIRAKNTENFLLGKLWNEEIVEQAEKILQDEFTPLSDFRGSSWYRTKISSNLLKKFYLVSSKQIDQTGVVHYE
ncbi:MAG: xanthine dehydrogenase small subunit [Candidatus Cloacimonadota bacterium]|nr:MAG: xanthine dehydrogenase small subunit [Candidatus Cloacimonadota bacterium]